MPRKWKRLQLAYEGPPLLFSFVATSDGYQVHITDLTYMWSEQCNHRAILKRADERNTTIDPSEDPEQFRVLLKKIDEALRGCPGSSVSLNNGRSPESLELIAITKLPAPLKPLKWPLYLSKEPQPSSTGHLLLPMLRETAGFESRERALLEQIKNKDWVLGKLFDKIETMGIDLGTVFPGTSGLRAGRTGTTLEQAARYIKGVAPFDELTWTNEASKLSPASGLAANLVAEASGSGTAEDLSPAEDKWWSCLPAEGTLPAEPRRKEEKTEEHQPPAPRDDMEVDTDAEQGTDEDEFERLETPPRMKQHRSPPTEDAEPSRARQTPSPEKRPSRGIGTIGGTKQSTTNPIPPDTATPTPSPEAKPQPAKEPPAPSPSERDEETASESDHVSAPRRQETTKRNEPTKPKKAGVGVIGGKKKEMAPSPPPPGPSTKPKATPESPSAKRISKLGVIGGKKKDNLSPPRQLPPPSSKTTEPEAVPSPVFPDELKPKLGVTGGKSAKRKEPTTAGRGGPDELTSPTKEEPSLEASRKIAERGPSSPSPKIKRRKSPPPPPPPESDEEETEQERADRKREELKRQLEAKSKAPAKKKRKF